ncbi:MAG: DUF3781 domain-containing protein [Salinivirgaceae bacterium]|jgi:hypothetical protein|nr:DUF3781 domain-containing protein [Salinivirgaceae bacterium]
MTDNKQKITEHLCYTELAYKRINKKLTVNFSKKQIEMFIDEILKKTNKMFFTKTGKNYYVTNKENNIKITINSNTFRVITVNKIKK